MDGEFLTIADGNFIYSSVISTTEDLTKTVFAQTFFNGNGSANCTFSVTTTGLIRSLYFGEQFVFSDSASFVGRSEKYQFGPFEMFEDQFYSISIFGYKINPTIEVVYCFDGTVENEAQYTTFTRYVKKSDIATSTQVALYYKTITCTDSCDICTTT